MFILGYSVSGVQIGWRERHWKLEYQLTAVSLVPNEKGWGLELGQEQWGEGERIPFR